MQEFFSPHERRRGGGVGVCVCLTMPARSLRMRFMTKPKSILISPVSVMPASDDGPRDVCFVLD